MRLGTLGAAIAACLLASAGSTQTHWGGDEHEAGGYARPYDPLSGINPDGSIQARKPQDLPHRERWRYIPEGRLKPGNVFQRFLTSSFISPVFFREEDVGFGGGFSIVDTDFLNSRRRMFANTVVTYTSEGQQNYKMNWRQWLHHREVPGGGVVYDERSFVWARAGFSKTLTRRFFGLGAETPESAETSYTDEVSTIGVSYQTTVPEPASDWIVDVRTRYEHHNLEPGRVIGVPTTGAVFPQLVADGDDRDLLWIGGGVRYDTRDSVRNPYRGLALGAELDAALHTGGEVGSVTQANAVTVFRLPSPFHDSGASNGRAAEENPPTDVIALAASVAATHGELPFYALPSLGGSNVLRGFIGNRFTGRYAWTAGAEYRFWAIPRGVRVSESFWIERLGMALFYELGSVGDDVSSLVDASVHQSWGTSFRIALERDSILRVDLGWSDEDFNVSIAYGLPF